VPVSNRRTGFGAELFIGIHPSVWLQVHREDLPSVQISIRIFNSIPPNPEMSEVLKGTEELATLALLLPSSLPYGFHVC